MKSIRNKSRAPLAIPLPRGKKLHLGPGKLGEIADGAAEHPPLLKLVEAGQVEVLDSGSTSTGHANESSVTRGTSTGHSTGAQVYRKGDR